MKLRLFLILLLVLPLSHAQTLVIGTSSQNPPFSSLADQKGDFFGFDIDIMGEICNHMKESCRFTPVNFSDVYTTLQSGKVDLVISAMIRTTDKQQNFLFSIPYLASNGQYVALQQSGIDTPEDIRNKKVGTRINTPFKAQALKIYNNQIMVSEFPNIPALLEALGNNKVNVALMDEAAAKYWYANNSTLYKLIGIKVPIGEGYAIMTNKGQDALIAKVNQAILNMGADGTYLKIYTRYFGN